MGNFTKKLKKKSMSNNLETPLYRVKYSNICGNHIFVCYDFKGNEHTTMIPGFIFDELTRDDDPKMVKKQIMRGFGDIITILACREDLREVFVSYDNHSQMFLIYGCGIYHECILNDSNTQEDFESCYNSIHNALASYECGAEKWFEAYTKTFVDMGNQIGWSPVAMKLEA